MLQKSYDFFCQIHMINLNCLMQNIRYETIDNDNLIYQCILITIKQILRHELSSFLTAFYHYHFHFYHVKRFKSGLNYVSNFICEIKHFRKIKGTSFYSTQIYIERVRVLLLNSQQAKLQSQCVFIKATSLNTEILRSLITCEINLYLTPTSNIYPLSVG